MQEFAPHGATLCRHSNYWRRSQACARLPNPYSKRLLAPENRGNAFDLRNTLVIRLGVLRPRRRLRVHDDISARLQPEVGRADPVGVGDLALSFATNGLPRSVNLSVLGAQADRADR